MFPHPRLHFLEKGRPVKEADVVANVQQLVGNCLAVIWKTPTIVGDGLELWHNISG